MSAVNNYINFIKFYNELITMSSAICTEKGGIAKENYIGRFFIADVLEFIKNYSRRIDVKDISDDLKKVILYIDKEFEKVKHLTTASKKPIHKMTLEEFEKIIDTK